VDVQHRDYASFANRFDKSVMKTVFLTIELTSSMESKSCSAVADNCSRLWIDTRYQGRSASRVQGRTIAVSGAHHIAVSGAQNELQALK
jgi:hypothetical protein